MTSAAHFPQGGSFSFPICTVGVVGLSESLGVVNARGSHFFPPGGVAGSPRRASPPPPRLQGPELPEAWWERPLLLAMLWPVSPAGHGRVMPSANGSVVLGVFADPGRGRPHPRPASGTLRACVDVGVVMNPGVSSAPSACSLRALFPPAQYQDPTSFPEGPRDPPALRVSQD